MTTYAFLVRVEADRPEQAYALLATVRADSVEEVFITEQGRVLTGADLEKLADEAERGYDTSQILRRRAK